MPRRPPLVRPQIPLLLVTPVIKLEIRKAGEALERIVVKKSGLRYYNISIHTRPVKRELQSGVTRSGKPREGEEP